MTDTQRENLEVYIWEDDEADETTSSVTEETVSEEGLADARGRKAGRAKALFVGLLFALGFGGVLLGGAFWFLHAAEQSDLAAGASPVVETVGETELAQRLLAWQEERRQEAQRKAEEERLRREAEEAERARLEYEALLAATPEEVTLVFGGDILFDDRYAAGQTMAARGGMAPCLEEGVLAVLQDADLAILNNEFPYTDGGTPLADKQYTFRAPTRTVEWLGEAGVDLVALANNHCFDYGEAGWRKRRCPTWAPAAISRRPLLRRAIRSVFFPWPS